ncbi:hypothetical protein CLV63_116160 [Murinocardiopsis flavida]|uniref:ATP-grasp domain-containing protein n=1 Tax=Murinocardiopsis flavida TaxID=645275 RepID=A0A2P8D975_9ACTN|nr:ATP-grasp domain-containing protein [Murinocardiopsis flavida]PSK93753.1 hypothetical protein CLV63_116160 [Murinocardiopsis flavida]
MAMPVVVPGDPLRPARADPHFHAEADTARSLGAPVALLDHDALLNGRPQDAARRIPAGLGPTWYRGWMIPAHRYTELADTLAARGSPLNVPAPAYRSAHELPGWYPHFTGATPASAWCAAAPHTPPGPERLAALAAPLGPGPGMVKDYVKSRKHEWDDACYVPDLADTATLHRVAARMVRLQGDDLCGGVVVRVFADLTGAEVRVWWIRGRPAAAGAHPDTPEQAPALATAATDAVAPMVQALGHPFVTTDLAASPDGAWTVVEVGDGQVSDRPATLDPAVLLAPLLGG